MLLSRQLKSEFRREPSNIAFHRLVERTSRDLVYRRQVAVKHHLNAANRENAIANASHILRRGQCMTPLATHVASLSLRLARIQTRLAHGQRCRRCCNA